VRISKLKEDMYNELLHSCGVIHFTNSPKAWYAGLPEESKHPKKRFVLPIS
jgi:hypothetical protein